MLSIVNLPCSLLALTFLYDDLFAAVVIVAAVVVPAVIDLFISVWLMRLIFSCRRHRRRRCSRRRRRCCQLDWLHPFVLLRHFDWIHPFVLGGKA